MCSYAGADKAGGQKLAYPFKCKAAARHVQRTCGPQFVMKAFRKGADGVMVLDAILATVITETAI